MLVGMDAVKVVPCPAEFREAALRRLFAAQAASQRGSLDQAVAAMDGAAPDAWRGLLATDDSAPAGAVWVQTLPGNTAVVWPPPPDCPAFDALLRAAASYADAQRFALAQMIVGDDEGFPLARIERCGFARLAELHYMAADAARQNRANRNTYAGLAFQPRAGDDPQRLASLVERTYAGTLDCPRLDGVRQIDDVLAGYRAQGRHLPHHWYLVSDFDHNDDGGQDVGVLILADHPATECWELVYMGVVPAARGAGRGAAIVRYALETAAHAGAARVILAVDAANEPALAMYRRAGFAAWDRRLVYARLSA